MKHPLLKDNTKFKLKLTGFEKFVLCMLIVAAVLAVASLWVTVHFITKFW